MARAVPIHQALLDQTIAMLAKVGLENISLRTIATQAGCTTAVIFQQYQGKAGLLAASLERALDRDNEAHSAMLADISGLITNHAVLSDFLANYISARANEDVPRFWSEVLFKSQQIPEGIPYMRRWFAMRTDFWQTVLGDAVNDGALAAIIAAYTVMEEVYAYPLAKDVQYQLLLNETARALTETSFGLTTCAVRPASVSATLDKAPLPSTSAPSSAFDMREQLLGHAIHTIVENGIGTVNQRTLTEKAGVSSSMIAYHFNDMKSFVNEAVWRALVYGIPAELDPDRGGGMMPTTMQSWFDALEIYVRPRIGNAPAGFYTGFARITGQACLLADSRPSLMPLVRHLRALEGWGTYRVGQALNPAVGVVARDQAAAFGMWIKAEAVLREAGLRNPTDGAKAIADVAQCIFPRAI